MSWSLPKLSLAEKLKGKINEKFKEIQDFAKEHDLQGAIDATIKALDMAVKLKNPELFTKYNALLVKLQGQYDKAEPLYKKATSRRHSIFHPKEH